MTAIVGRARTQPEDPWAQVCAAAATMFDARAAAPADADLTEQRWQTWIADAHPHQQPPPGDWRVWLLLAGRGSGKTRGICEWAADRARRFPGCRIALVGATFADGRDTLVEGDSGMLSVLADSELRGGNQDRAWNRSLGELFLANGSRFKVYSAEKPRQLRGPQHHFAVADEVAFWPDSRKGTAKDTTWSNLNIGVRLPAKPGWPDGFESQIAVATTPRPVALLTQRDPDQQSTNPGLMDQPTTVTVKGRTVDNEANLTDSYRRTVIEPMRGTRLGRQELDGELIWDVEGALWRLDQLDDDKVTGPPELMRVVIGVDPAVTNKPDSDETGIVAVGLDRAWRLGGHGYVLGDYSGRYSVADWGMKVVRAAVYHRADTIAAEKNQGHDLVVKLVDDSWDILVDLGETEGLTKPRVEAVNSYLGKQVRARPIAGQYEQHRWHHVRGLGQLEDQLTTWVPDEGDSPDRLDALVHAATELTGGGGGYVQMALPPATEIPGTTPPVKAAGRTGITRPVGGMGMVPAGVSVVPSLGDLQGGGR